MAGCKQVFSNRDFTSIGTTALYRPPMAGYVSVNSSWAASAAAATQKVLADGDFRNLNATLGHVPSVGASRTFTLYKNGVATAMTFVIGAAGLTGSSSTVVPVVAGDLIYIEMATAGIPTNTRVEISVEFNGAAACETMYGGSGALSAITSLHYASLFSNAIGWRTASAGNSSYVSAPGTITDLNVLLTTAAGGSTTRVFTIYKNGAAQDGSGGTPDTRVSFTGSSVDLTSTFSLAIAAGDDVQVRQTATGPPAATDATFTAKVVSTTDTYSNVSHWTNGSLPTSGTNYTYPGPDSWGATEAGIERGGLMSSVVLRDFRGKSNSTVTNQTYTTRKNLGATAQSFNITGGSTGSDLANTVALAPGDTFDLEAVGDGGFIRAWMCAWTLEAPSDYVHQVLGSAVFGETTTVTAPRAVAFGLDGATNTHADEGVLKVFGDVEVTGSSTLASGSLALSDFSDVSFMALAALDVLTYNGTNWANTAPVVRYTEVAISSAELLALRATPKTLVAAPGSGKIAEFIGAVLLLDATATAFVESAANLAVRYTNGSGAKVSEDIETTTFIDQTTDTLTTARPKLDAIVAKSGCENQLLCLHNLGAGEYTTGTGVMRVKVAYRIWSTGW